MRGGISIDLPEGLSREDRDRLRAELDTLPEGAILRPEDAFAHTPSFVAMAHLLRGVDLIHLFDGYYTPVIETTYLRRPPARRAVLAAYSEMTGAVVKPAGAYAAWCVGLAATEPACGWRYLTDGPTRVIAFLPEPMSLAAAPPWLLGDTPADDILRALHEASERETEAYKARFHADRLLDQADLERLAGRARDLRAAAADHDDPKSMLAGRIDALLAPEAPLVAEQ